MSAAADAKAPPRDHVRETLETLVFVVVLVLILQLFVLEAFVIPTGSMAETQLGYHKDVVCRQCQYAFPVNASEEAEGKAAVRSYTCPNCQYEGSLDLGGITSGDRVLVHKAMGPDERGRVMVFKYPVAPQSKQQAQNYIKRCVGYGGETVAIGHGDLYVTTALTYPGRPKPEDARDIWQTDYTYNRDPEALDLFAKGKDNGFPSGVGGFELYRKSDELALEMRRLVFDNDHQPADIGTPRWGSRSGDGDGWAANGDAAKAFTHQGDAVGWIGYRHLSRLRPTKTQSATDEPQEITNTMGYNCNRAGTDDYFWVGDLMLECTAKLDATSEITLELSKGEHRYQAAFANGTVTLVRLGAGNWAPVRRPTPITKAGTYDLRFANFDSRLRVWVNGTAIDFNGEADYPPTKADDKPTKKNDIQAPAGIAAKGTVEVTGLRLWRDTYYTPDTTSPGRASADTVETYYVHPGHYLCLGDNSAQSSDGRRWGVVPERLMIGRAVFTFWPAYPKFRIGVIR